MMYILQLERSIKKYELYNEHELYRNRSRISLYTYVYTTIDMKDISNFLLNLSTAINKVSISCLAKQARPNILPDYKIYVKLLS